MRKVARETAKALGGVVVGLGGLLVLVVALLLVVGGSSGWATSWKTDGAVMKQRKAQLRLVAVTLDRLPVGHGRPAHPSGCLISSGDLFQPRVNKVWDAHGPDVRRQALGVLGAMKADGWTVESQHPQFAEIELRRSFGGWTAKATLWWIDPHDSTELELDQGVFVEALVDGVRPCIEE
jgi:hypothetical protein